MLYDTTAAKPITIANTILLLNLTFLLSIWNTQQHISCFQYTYEDFFLFKYADTTEILERWGLDNKALLTEYPLVEFHWSYNFLSDTYEIIIKTYKTSR